METLKQAWDRVRSRWRVVVALTLANLLLTMLASRPLSAALSPLLDGRPAAGAMVRGDDGLLAELLSDHPEAFNSGLGAAQALVILWGILAWVLAGGILSTMALGPVGAARGSVRDLLAASSTHAWRMLKLGALGLLTRLVPLLLAGAVWLALRPILHSRGFAQLAVWSLVTGLVLAVTWSWATVAVDYARAIALTDPISVPRALARGLRRSLRAPTVAIVLFSVGGFGLITLLHAAIAHRLPAEPLGAAVVAFLLRVVAAFARTTVTVTALVAAGLAGKPSHSTPVVAPRPAYAPPVDASSLPS
jgi:hypothetical protein